MNNATSFGAHAKAYAEGRPGYPPELFDFIAAEAPGCSAVLDVGTGSGQAALALSERFDQVFATDISEEQIAHAAQAENIRYFAAPAEASSLPDNSVDAVTVATALHWFDFSRFWDEVRRVSRPDGIFCGWAYHLIEGDPEVDRVLLRPLYDLIDPYWAEGNRLTLRGYPRDEIQFPFDEIIPPDVSLTPEWTLSRLIQFAETWSGTTRARVDGQGEAIDRIESQALDLLGDRACDLKLPISVVAGRVA
ncbi:MAG: class I SAM-dependent methyltransferase [Planctomycetota bacterium]